MNDASAGMFRPALLPCSYRSSERHDEHLWRAAERPLREAGEALNLAVLCLEGEEEPDREGARLRQAAQARSFLIEAVRALGLARLYMPSIRLYSVPVIMAVDPDLEAELARLHQLATRLLWYNHAVLPARHQARPLQPHEEAQLAVVFRGLARTGRALRHAWLATAIMVAVVAPTLGIVAVSLLLATVVAAVAGLHIACAASPALDGPPTSS